MIIYVDIDDTICKTISTDYNINCVPYHDKIKVINDLYDDGHTIVYWTARGTVSGIDHTELTKRQLKEWGVKYHDLKLKKPAYDIFIDDKALTDINQLKNILQLRIK